MQKETWKDQLLKAKRTLKIQPSTNEAIDIYIEQVINELKRRLPTFNIEWTYFFNTDILLLNFKNPILNGTCQLSRKYFSESVKLLVPVDSIVQDIYQELKNVINGMIYRPREDVSVEKISQY